MRKPKMISCQLQEISFIAITWNPESNCTCRKKNHFLFRCESYRRYQKHSYIIGCSVGEKDWWSLERGWRKRIIRCVDRIHKIRSTLGKATRRMHMVREETYGETNNLSSWWCVARYVEIYVRCSEKESKTKMGYRETKARQCQTTERNILHWTKRRRIQAHNESRW